MTVEPLVDVVTGEVIEVALTPTQARDLTDRIRQTLVTGHDLIIQAARGSAWSALGYATWDDYCVGEFSEARMIRMEVGQRREIVAEMRQAGMSTRAIASGLGINNATVSRDLASGVANATPAEPEHWQPRGVGTDEARAAYLASTSPVIGLDGKTYQPPAPRPQPQKPRPQRDDAEVVLNRVLKSSQDAAREAQSLSPAQLTRISSQAAHWVDGLTDAIESLQRLVISINGDTP